MKHIKQLNFRKLHVRVFNWNIELGLTARCSWSHFKIHDVRESRFGPSYGKHLVWGKLSISIDQSHLIPMLVHEGCGGAVHGIGEDGIDYCESCETIVEGDTEYITMEEYEAG